MVDFSDKGQATRSCDVFLVFRFNKLLNKQLNCQWSEMPWHSCDVIIMTSLFFFSKYIRCLIVCIDSCFYNFPCLIYGRPFSWACCIEYHIDGSVQDCSISSALVMEICSLLLSHQYFIALYHIEVWLYLQTCLLLYLKLKNGFKSNCLTLGDNEVTSWQMHIN